ncbi:tRNA (adenosine(37)-N6)-threonylcarbamoyltransferase complex transferase subunit TsaD [Frigidibacter sp. ROC022]|uniref:tRNA (adenosine(37)-N6)-threonylcarbamoyltransferase complex transferase subunit TsaD n=1 Tax=Frigidibacter sp. ROC022 TaxID=2971796 RepID=UPI00215A5B31|nr:tRNA (adenosine(37)-N6)-threonylcarbamoyltransferase complex transferase subunit TsaD [Frigidibacter sp. ROC022]MCR8724507.1 tRNA (adenosine(37)-N6)-threonylcarbamoyltransferase complex transferase subunit TsaD [Frigidibacter sp. ROC022]
MATATGGDRIILGIESSCDDTAAAVVQRVDGRAHVLSSVVLGQTALHADFGGVVPEIAARAHSERLDAAIAQALAEAALGFDDLDGIAVTAGPGLIGGLVSAVVAARAIAAARGLPLVGVNHLAGHALSPQFSAELPFPYLLLLVSGGHCQFLLVRGPDGFERLGGTIDDAPGEAFDKVARLLGLPQPGGPSVEEEARRGDAARFAFPRPLLDRAGMDLSFSGLKTAVLRERDRLVAGAGGLRRQDRADICAGFQAAVADVLAEKAARAISVYLGENPANPALCVAGGVASNATLRSALQAVASSTGCRFVAPPLALCTDNAAMIAWAGLAQFDAGSGGDFAARPRWPLDQDAAPMLGAGKKGAKA